MIEQLNTIIPLNDDNIGKINRESIVGYVMVCADFYANNGDVYIFSIEHVVNDCYIMNVFRGQLHYDPLHENSIYKLIPETYGFYEVTGFSDKIKKHPDGWTFAAFQIGYYCFFPKDIAYTAEGNWLEYCVSFTNKESLLIKGILEACVQYEREVVSAITDKNHIKKNCVTDNILYEIFALYPDSWKNPKQFRSLLADMLPNDKLRRNLIYLSLEECIPNELVGKTCINNTKVVTLKKRLIDAYAWSDSVAADIINLWIDAFGISVEDNSS